ncbi:MAG: ABC transporter substrate-binding protein [Hyphomicrobiales bacterium]
MSGKYFDSNDTLLTITNKYPETIRVFKANGFPQMDDPEKRELFGANITLEVALNFRQIDMKSFSVLLEETIEQERNKAEASSSFGNGDSGILVKGLLPCPIRIPLTEQMEAFAEKLATDGTDIKYELQAASMGVDWIRDDWAPEATKNDLADVYLSAGFDMFFDEKKMGRFKKDDVFADRVSYDRLNKDFDNDYVSLKDPSGHYSIIGVVPAVFLVNKNELNGRKVPQSWEDILSPEFEKSVSLPIGDFDLFNAILLSLYRLYGEKALEKLGRSLLTDMHPSQMVRSHKKQGDKPAVTIMPYFFTKMVKEGGTMAAVWPSDGAIISPIFMLTKSDTNKNLQPVIDFLASKKVGELLAHQGLFPSTHPEVDNRVPEENKYLWLGWDYVYENDIQTLVDHCEKAFNRGADL